VPADTFKAYKIKQVLTETLNGKNRSSGEIFLVRAGGWLLRQTAS
jgi:hypothetical protein